MLVAVEISMICTDSVECDLLHPTRHDVYLAAVPPTVSLVPKSLHFLLIKECTRKFTRICEDTLRCASARADERSRTPPDVSRT